MLNDGKQFTNNNVIYAFDYSHLVFMCRREWVCMCVFFWLNITCSCVARAHKNDLRFWHVLAHKRKNVFDLNWIAWRNLLKTFFISNWIDFEAWERVGSVVIIISIAFIQGLFAFSRHEFQYWLMKCLNRKLKIDYSFSKEAREKNICRNISENPCWIEHFQKKFHKYFTWAHQH